MKKLSTIPMTNKTAKEMAEELAEQVGDEMNAFHGFSKEQLVEDLLPRFKEMEVGERYIKVLSVLFPDTFMNFIGY